MVGATSGTLKKQESLAITVLAPPTFTLTSSSTSISVVAGASNSLTLTTMPNSAFSAAVTWSVSGLPTGMTAQFSPGSVVAARGAGTTVVTFAAASNVAAKAYPATLTATGGGVTEKQTIAVTVTKKSGGTIRVLPGAPPAPK